MPFSSKTNTLKAYTTVNLELIKENEHDIYWNVSQQEARTESENSNISF